MKEENMELKRKRKREVSILPSIIKSTKKQFSISEKFVNKFKEFNKERRQERKKL
jgi:hypothetical protein